MLRTEPHLATRGTIDGMTPGTNIISLTAAAAKRADSPPFSAFVHAGQLFTSAAPTVVSTILGSCVAVCLWDPSRRTGGVNHYLLPRWTGQGEASLRFGNIAIATLIADLVTRGCRPRDLRARVYGGAAGVAAGGASPGEFSAQNVAVARRLLRAAGIRVASEDVGGDRSRKVMFRTDDGSVTVRTV
jgi:chemotaxis protein CheD